MLKTLTTAVTICLVPSVTFAQDWVSATDANERYHTSSFASADGQMVFHCGVVLEGEASLAEEPGFPGPGHVNLTLDPALLDAGADVYAFEDATLFAFGQEWPMPAIYKDEMNGGIWSTRLPVDNPLVDAMIGGAEAVLLVPGAEPVSFYAPDPADILTELLDGCAAAGAPEAAPSPDTPDAMWSQAVQAVNTACNGDWAPGQGAMVRRDVTGDGADDLMVDYAQVTCLQGTFAGKQLPCPDEMCRHDIWTEGQSEPLIFYAVDIQNAPDRAGDILVYLSASACESMGRDFGCASRMRWMMGTFGTIGIE